MAPHIQLQDRMAPRQNAKANNPSGMNSNVEITFFSLYMSNAAL